MTKQGKSLNTGNRKGCVPILFVTMSGFLFILALLPWILTRFQPQVLIPDDLIQEQLHYEQTVAAAQEATIEAMRQVTSVSHIRTIGTVAATEVVKKETTEAINESSTVIISTTTIQDATRTVEPTLEDIPLESQITPTPNLSLCTSVEDGVFPATPAILNDVEDILTAEEITEQLTTDASESDFSDIKVFLSEDGVRITSVLTVLPGITQLVEAIGVFIVKNDSLKVIFYSITADDVDVTEQHCKQLQSRMDSSLYRLLPERYVQSFVLSEGKIVVYSKVRP